MIDVGMSVVVAVVVVPPSREGRASTHPIGVARPRYLANNLMRPHKSAESVSRVDVHPFAYGYFKRDLDIRGNSRRSRKDHIQSLA
jgi:hypothetical protein